MTASRPAANRPVIDLDAGRAHQYGYRNPLTLNGPRFTAAPKPTSTTETSNVPAQSGRVR